MEAIEEEDTTPGSDFITAKGYKGGSSFDLDLKHLGSGVWLREDAAVQAILMRDDALRVGLMLRYNSGFRTLDEQKVLYRKRQLYDAYREAIDNWLKSGMNGVEPERVAFAARAAYPGYSNHQSGIDLDVNRAPGDNPKTAIPDSPIDLWLNENAARFGFKRTVRDEPWHYEFVGVPASP